MQKSTSVKHPPALAGKAAREKARPGGADTPPRGKRNGEDSPELLIEELARLFLHLQASPRGEPGRGKACIPDVAETLGEASRQTGIPVERLCGTLLEKILAESGCEDGGRTPSRSSAKERILDAALEVFSQKGFHTATTEEIAERAGVGKGTLYRHFETKERLFAELVRLRLDELETKAGSITGGNDDVLTMITKYIRVYFEFFDRNQHLYRLIVQEQLDLGEHAPDMYFRRVMRALPQLKRKVYEGSQQGFLKDVDFQTVFYGTMGFVHGVIEKWLARACSYSLVEELPGVLEVLFYGFVKNPRTFENEN